MGEDTFPAHVAQVRSLTGRLDLCRVDITGIGVFRLDAVTANRLALRSGMEIDANLLVRIREAAAQHDAQAIALRLLQRRLRSRAELEGALRRRGVPRETVVSTVSQLIRIGWIDDARFARAWIRDRLALHPSGARRLRAELAAKGVKAQIIQEALVEMVPESLEDELALAQARVRLRRLRGLPSDVVRRRLIGWLYRRGFAPSVVAAAVAKLKPALLGRPDVDPTA